jgi:hypothetical protein
MKMIQSISTFIGASEVLHVLEAISKIGLEAKQRILRLDRTKKVRRIRGNVCKQLFGKSQPKSRCCSPKDIFEIASKQHNETIENNNTPPST